MFSEEADVNVSLRQSGNASALKYEQEARKKLSSKQAKFAGTPIFLAS